MASPLAASGGSNPPVKPWQRASSTSGPVPFKPSSLGSTSDAVEASGTAQPGEIVSSANRNVSAVNTNSLGRPVPTRPWEQPQQSYGGYGSNLNYNSGYGAGMYNSSYGGLGSYGGFGGSYGGGLYGNNMYRGGYGGLYGGGMYGGGMYNGLGGSMGGYGGGYGGMGMGGPYGEQDPNNPFGAPSSPPSFWVSLMRVMQGVVTFFGRIAILIDQNTQAFHMFMTALLQLFDRSGLLYGELARFVLRILGIRTKPKKFQPPGPHMLLGPHNSNEYENNVDGTKVPASGGWDNVWGGHASN